MSARIVLLGPQARGVCEVLRVSPSDAAAILNPSRGGTRMRVSLTPYAGPLADATVLVLDEATCGGSPSDFVAAWRGLTGFLDHVAHPRYERETVETPILVALP